MEFAERELKKTLEGLARHLFGSDIETKWGAPPVALCRSV